MKHTKSPWRIAHSGYANSPFVIYVGQNEPQFANRNKYPLQGVNWIAEVRHDESEQHREQIANVHLIASAPELLEALKNLIASSDHISPFGPDATVKGVRLAGKYMAAMDKAKAAIAKAEGR